jgi:hypothetical protein
MSTTHTPGPWRVMDRPGKGYGKEWLVYTPKGLAFVGNQLEPDGVSIGAAQANARLAAAAPDLLAALQNLVDRYPSNVGMNAARDAIKKATVQERRS